MGEHILVLAGTACPETEDKIQQEELSMVASLATLQAAGHAVTFVGGARYGFTLEDMQAAISQNPDASTLIVHAHGNIRHKRHYLALKPKPPRPEGDKKKPRRGRKMALHINGCVWAEDFYQAVADAAGDRALNLFMFSCGSGNGMVTAIRQLPKGSTVVNLVDEGDVNSFTPRPEAFNIPANLPGAFAENLLLSLGVRSVQHGNTLQVAVADPSLSPDGAVCNLWGLWDLARMNTIGFESATFTDEERDMLTHRLLPLTTHPHIHAALKTIEDYTAAGMQAAEFNLQNTGLLVPLSARIDENIFRHRAAIMKVHGLMCCVGYLMNASDIGAFTAGAHAAPVQMPKRPDDKPAAAPTQGTDLYK